MRSSPPPPFSKKNHVVEDLNNPPPEVAVKNVVSRGLLSISPCPGFRALQKPVSERVSKLFEKCIELFISVKEPTAVIFGLL